MYFYFISKNILSYRLIPFSVLSFDRSKIQSERTKKYMIKRSSELFTQSSKKVLKERNRFDTV